MNAEPLTLAQAQERWQSLPYAWMMEESRVFVGKRPETLDISTLIEGRFFDETTEIRIFYQDGVQKASCITQEEGDVVRLETCPVVNRDHGQQLGICRHMAFDDDGQAYVQAVRLYDWR